MLSLFPLLYLAFHQPLYNSSFFGHFQLFNNIKTSCRPSKKAPTLPPMAKSYTPKHGRLDSSRTDLLSRIPNPRMHYLPYQLLLLLYPANEDYHVHNYLLLILVLILMMSFILSAQRTISRNPGVCARVQRPQSVFVPLTQYGRFVLSLTFPDIMK